ncbi:MAG: DMT family transporter [Pseudomonadota bacterium]
MPVGTRLHAQTNGARTLIAPIIISPGNPMSRSGPPQPSNAAPDAAKARAGVLAGIGWMLLTGVLFVGVTVIVAHLGTSLPAVEAAFIRYAIGFLLIAPALLRLRRHPPTAGDMGFYVGRGLVHGFGVMLWFYAMARIPIAEVTAIGYVAPIFVTLGAALFLGEALSVRRLGAVLVGFLGALIILRPGFQELNSGQLAQVLAAPAFAASFLMAKALTGRADSSVIVAMLSLFCTIALLPGALYYWKTPTLEEVAWLAVTAVVATAGHYTLTRAFQAAPITVTQPIRFLELVWASLLGIALFAQPVDPYVILGGAVIIAAATYISHREAQAAKR